MGVWGRYTNTRLLTQRHYYAHVLISMVYKWFWPGSRTSLTMNHEAVCLVHSKFTLDYCFKGQLDCKSALSGMKETVGSMVVYHGSNEEMGALIVVG